jgi:adenine phosphoribosyltransferase
MTLEELRSYVRDVPDFPKPGIVFKDITPMIATGAALAEVVERVAERYRGSIDVVLGIESRGFIIGAPVAHRLGLGLTLVRKPGKLPSETYTASYDLEYGTDSLQIHRDAFAHKSRVLIVDDLLATGGTASAAIELVRRLGGEVAGCAFIIELAFLKGRRRLDAPDVFSLLTYESE